jgi:DNA-binding MarR family transcriptional regulator
VTAHGDSVLLDVWAAGRLVEELLLEELEPYGLRPNVLSLLALIRREGPVTPTALGARLGMRPTTLRDLLGLMVERGHVLRVDHPTDGRSHLLELTREGEAFLDTAMPALDRVEARLERELGAGLGSLLPAVLRLRKAAEGALEPLSVR